MTLTIEVLEEKCVGCGRCISLCPTGTLKMNTETSIVYNTGNECDNLWGCIYVCPTRALDITEAIL